VHRTHERVTITENGRSYLVLMSAEDLESIEATLELLADAEAVRRVEQGAVRTSPPPAAAFAAWEFVNGPVHDAPPRAGAPLRAPSRGCGGRGEASTASDTRSTRDSEQSEPSTSTTAETPTGPDPSRQVQALPVVVDLPTGALAACTAVESRPQRLAREAALMDEGARLYRRLRPGTSPASRVLGVTWASVYRALQLPGVRR
jgi:hypothetical protein